MPSEGRLTLMEAAAVGNSTMNICAHIAAALPEVDLVEDSRLNTTAILAAPVPVSEGCFVLPEVPGHGLSLAPDAAARFGIPDA